MSLNLGPSLFPRPVSMRTRPASCSTSRQRNARRIRLRLSGVMRRSHSGFGTTPNIAPPSSHCSPPSRAWQVRRPNWKVVWVMGTRNAERGTRNSRGGVVTRDTLPFCSAFRVPTSALSQIVPPQRQRHTPRPAAAPHQLAPLHRDHGPLVVARLLLRRQGRGGHDREARVLELAQRGLVAGVRHGDARPHREEVAGRGPLLALL